MSVELSLYKLADALQIPIKYVDGKIEGGAKGVLKTSVGLEIPLEVKAVKLFRNDQCGILCSIVGDLSIVVSHFPKTGMVSAYLIDGDKLSMDGVKSPAELFISKKMSLREVVESLGKSIVASFYYKEGWKPLKLPQ